MAWAGPGPDAAAEAGRRSVERPAEGENSGHLDTLDVRPPHLVERVWGGNRFTRLLSDPVDPSSECPCPMDGPRHEPAPRRGPGCLPRLSDRSRPHGGSAGGDARAVAARTPGTDGISSRDLL